MPYVLADELFRTKENVTTRCREILSATPDGSLVSDSALPFLLDLFRHHDEWTQKTAGGVVGISTQTTIQGTRCFVLVRNGGGTIDISFPHAIRLIPSTRTAHLIPQGLRDFRSAARNGVEDQIRGFRDSQLVSSSVCPITGEALYRGNCAVDHTPPTTFDSLLFNFCQSKGINPITVAVGSKSGTVAVFNDPLLLVAWQEHHRANAVLRLVSRIGNLQLPKVVVQWSLLYQGVSSGA